MFMDFDRKLLEARGHGDYSRIPTAVLPPLWLAYVQVPPTPSPPPAFLPVRPFLTPCALRVAILGAQRLWEDSFRRQGVRVDPRLGCVN